MIISIRYTPGSAPWRWEIYYVGSDHAQGLYSHGSAGTWKDMMRDMEVSVSELEKRSETRISR